MRKGAVSGFFFLGCFPLPVFNSCYFWWGEGACLNLMVLVSYDVDILWLRLMTKADSFCFRYCSDSLAALWLGINLSSFLHRGRILLWLAAYLWAAQTLCWHSSGPPDGFLGMAQNLVQVQCPENIPLCPAVSGRTTRSQCSHLNSVMRLNLLWPQL